MNQAKPVSLGYGTTSLILVAVLAIVLIPASLFRVDEAEQAVLLQFGKPVGEPITSPGLKFKMPFVQEVRSFDKRILQWDDRPTEIPTLDREFIMVDSTARWRIVDPLKFLQSVQTVNVALSRIGDAINASVRDNISNNQLSEAVLSRNLEVSAELLAELDGVFPGDTQTLRIEVEVGRERITRRILEEAREEMAKFGIELIDVRIKRLNYNPDVRPEVYARMISERQRIATNFRFEGKKESEIIRGEVEKAVDIITSTAERTAEEIRGKADGMATRIYNNTYGVDPAFYSFFRTMESYGESFGEQSTMILKSDSQFFKYLREIPDSAPAAP